MHHTGGSGDAGRHRVMLDNGARAHPFTPAQRATGYRYQLSILQAAFVLTQVLDRAVSGWAECS